MNDQLPYTNNLNCCSKFNIKPTNDDHESLYMLWHHFNSICVLFCEPIGLVVISVFIMPSAAEIFYVVEVFA